MDPTLQNVAAYRQRVRRPYRAERLLARRLARPGVRALDLGCGDGRVTAELVRRGAKVCGCDLDPAALGALAGSPRPPGSIVCGDGRRLPLRDGMFDLVVFAFNGLDFVVPEPERLKALAEIDRVLAPRGAFVFSSHNPSGALLSPRRAWSAREWRSRLRWLRSGDWRRRVVRGRRGLLLYQARPAAVVREVTGETGLRLVRARAGRSGVRAPLWLLTWTSRWPYYEFAKIGAEGPTAEPRCRAAVAKRTLDLVVSAAALAALAPLMLAIAILVRVTLGRPVLFSQRRPGLGGRIFTLHKFRTMRPAPADVPDEERLTRLGRFLRATSLDELPELLDVLRGDMSLVGPRPLLPEYLDRYTPEQARRHLVPPGLTGWAQVRGRNELSWEEKFALDVWYVDHRSLLLDLRILAITVIRVLLRRGISQPGHATMPEFTGSAGPQGRIAGGEG